MKFHVGVARPKEGLLHQLYWPGGSTVVGGGSMSLIASSCCRLSLQSASATSTPTAARTTRHSATPSVTNVNTTPSAISANSASIVSSVTAQPLLMTPMSACVSNMY